MGDETPGTRAVRAPLPPCHGRKVVIIREPVRAAANEGFDGKQQLA